MKFMLIYSLTSLPEKTFKRLRSHVRPKQNKVKIKSSLLQVFASYKLAFTEYLI